MSRITFLGLRAMGRRMAQRLIDAGHTVTVWNRSDAAATALQAHGALVAASPREAAEGAEFVIAMVYDDIASRQVWLDPVAGAALGMAATAIAIESSTLTPAWVIELGQALRARGVELVDAPVAGSRPQAEAGQLIYMVGGTPQAVAAASPVLAHMGGGVHHVGGPGSGAWLKLSVNALFAAQVAAMAEQLSLLRGAGLDPDVALAALRAMPVTSPAAAGAAALMLAANYTPQAPVDLIAKDLEYALQSAAQLGRELPVTAIVHARLRAASAAGFGGENLVAIAKLYP